MKSFLMLVVATLISFTTFAQKAKANIPSKSTAQVQYTCPMHPDIVSSKPGNCPKCKSELVLDRKSSKQASKVFTCSMHPDVASNTAGKCPICGMELKKATSKKG